MTRASTLAGYAVIAVVLVAYQAAGLVWRRTPTLAEAAASVIRRPLARAIVLAWWLWVGWHVFVRADWR